MSTYLHAYAIVNIKTTGFRILQDSIIEIAVRVFKNSRNQCHWYSLIKPTHTISSSIQAITGITNIDANNAPAFKEVAYELFNLLSDKLFIVHNASFDYSFLQNAFKQIGLQFKTNVLCTLKRSQQLYPEFNQHQLDAIITRHDLKIKTRHRHKADTLAVQQFIEHCSVVFDNDKLNKIIKDIIQKPSLPAHLKTDIKCIPDSPGVYLFYNDPAKNPGQVQKVL